MGHDTVEGLPATVAHSRRTVGARRVPADYRPPTRLRPGRSGARDYGFALAAVLTLGTFNGLVQAGDPLPVVVDSIEPTEIVQGQVPQPEIQVFGSNFIEGLPSETNRPTVTLRHVDDLAEYSALAFVNFAGTVATVPPWMWNLLQAPLGVYDVIVTRPTDNASDTLKGAFTVTDGEPDPGEIALVVRSTWGGSVNDVEIVGDLAYAAIGRRLVILNVADPANPFEVGSMNIMPGVNGVTVRDGYAFLAASNPYQFTVVDVSDPTNLTLISVSTGSQFSHDVVLYGDLAYVRSGLGHLDIFDITDPLNVVSLGDPLSNVAAMSIVGDLLYVGTSIQCCQADLKIYDLASDPMNPILLGSVNDVGVQTTALAVEGDYVYWTVRHDGGWFSLEVVDVSIPESPTIVASETGFVWARDVAVAGGYAYVADATTSVPQQNVGDWALTMGLGIFDVSDPTNPTLAATYKTHGNVTGIKIVGNRAYVHDDGEGLIILDVSDPTNPVRLGSYHSPAVLRKMKKVGDLLYVADAWNGFTVLDVADAAHPEVVSVYLADHYNDLAVDAWGIDVQDDLVYLGAGHLGLEVVDVSDPAYPAFVGAFRIPSGVPACSTFAAVTVWVWGDDPRSRYASIGFEEHFCFAVGGVFLNVDVTNPQDMFEAGRFLHEFLPRASKITLNEQGIAFLGRSHPIYNNGNNQNGRETTVDVSIPAIVHSGAIAPVTDTALADGNILYLTNGDSDNAPGLYIQDVTDPANPVFLAHVDENYPLGDGVELNDAFAVAVQNDRVYVVGRGCTSGCGTKATYLFDTADPEIPLFLDAVPYAGGTRSSVDVDEPDLFVANESGGGSQVGGLVLLELVGLNPFGDLDGDGSVGASDLLILLASWGPCPPKGECPADLNDDGSVGAADLLILLVNWG